MIGPPRAHICNHIGRDPLSGKRGTTFPMYSMPSCDRTTAQASASKEMRTLRSKPSLCAFRNARSDRAIWFGDLCIGSVSPRDRYHLLHRNGGTRGCRPNR